MKNACLAVAAVLAFPLTPVNAADLPQPITTAPAPAPSMPTASTVPNSAFFLGLGASANWIHFTDQHVYAIGTSNVYTDGILSASGSAQGPTNIGMGGRFPFAPSFQGGYFQRFGASDWLWGARFVLQLSGSDLDKHELDYSPIRHLHHSTEPYTRTL
jgi:hypothetical protein